MAKQLDMLTSSLADSPARTSVSQTPQPKVSTEPEADSSSSCSESSARLDQIGSSLRTHLRCALEGQTGYSMKWKDKGTPAGRSWWVLGISSRPIAETVSGLLPTPTNQSQSGGVRWGGGTGASRVLKEVGLHRWGNDAHLLPTPNTPNGGRRVSKDAEWKGTTAYLNGKKQQVGLETAILGHLPTPTATDEWHRRNPSQLRRKSPSTQALLLAGHLPTPTATEYGSSNNGCPRDGRREEFATKGKPSLRYMLTPTATANLNSPSMDKWAGARALRSLMESLGVGGTVALARIYQWMMGYPRGWLDSGSKPTETP